jgi:N-methylhydantoinase B
VKVQRDYEDIDDIIAMCEMRLRVPTQWRGDYLAMVGAARTGERELLALGADLGWDELADLCDDWLDYSEETVAAAISRLPAGSARGHTTYDPIPESPGGIEIGATVVVDPDAAHISVDLTDNADCLPCGLNLSEACARTAALIGIFNSLGASVPHNAGSFRRIDVTLRANCIVGIPWHPTSTSAATTNVSDRVIGAVQLALAEIEEDAGMAEFGAVMPGSAAVIAGSDPRTGERFVNQLLLAMTGGAASPRCDGWLTACHAGNGGLIYYDSIEMDELAFPILINQRRLAPDTEGAGRSRGAPSALVEYGPIEGAEMSALYSADGSVNPARGARGGGAGGLSRHRKVGADGSVTDLAPSPGTALRAGERIQSWTSGGGGYGDPFRRDLEAVALDVREGWVSPRRAADVYGVAVAADGAIDEERTRELRTGTGEGGDDE